MADNTPQDTTQTQNTPVDQPVIQPEPPKVDETPVEIPPTETPPEEKPTSVEELKPEPDLEVPETSSTPEPPKEEPKQEEQKPAEETKPEEKPVETKAEEPKSEEKPKEEVKPEPESLKPLSPDEALAKSGPNLDELRAKANKERQDRKQEHLAGIEKLAKSKQINNDDVRELLHVSQSTATSYLEELTKQGKIKKSGKAKATSYSS